MDFVGPTQAPYTINPKTISRWVLFQSIYISLRRKRLHTALNDTVDSFEKYTEKKGFFQSLS